MDLRGHGLSDAPTDDGAYDLAVLAEDVVAVAEGSGLLDRGPRRAPGCRARRARVRGDRRRDRGAVELGARCAGLVLVDGGWESLEASTGVDVDEFLRGLDEPPEVMRSMRGVPAPTAAASTQRPGTPTRSRAARATVVETHAGRVVPATRPHALEACVRTMFTYDPIATLTAVDAPIIALVAADDEDGTRAAALRACPRPRGRRAVGRSSTCRSGTTATT